VNGVLANPTYTITNPANGQSDTITFDLHPPLRLCGQNDVLFVSQRSHLISDGGDQVGQV